jgi:DNA mismatch endonuclease (patch repair protein)
MDVEGRPRGGARVVDVMTPEQRHKAMAHNRGRTKPELALARALWSLGARYLTHRGYRKRFGAGLPGSPDMIFTGQRMVVFVDGCFWHGCADCSGIPTQSGEFWARKIAANRERDRQVTQASVLMALAIARTLGTTVEELFRPTEV